MIEVIESLSITALNSVEPICKIKTKICKVSMFESKQPDRNLLVKKWMQTSAAQFLINNKVDELQLVTLSPDWYDCTHDLWAVMYLPEQKLTEYYLKFTEEL